MLQAITPVILSGGSGTRLWPLSRETFPKQFVSFDEGESLFVRTLQRVRRLPATPSPLVVCNEEHRFYTLQALQETSLQATILLEPVSRNTAPALALAALALCENGHDPIMLVMPSDHALDDDQAFCQSVCKAAPFAEQGAIVTFGIKPVAPETGYGYIKQGESEGDCYRISQFVEKPDMVRAGEMLEEGGYLWNSGIFLLRASVYLEELSRYAPELYKGCRTAWQKRQNDASFCRPDREAFAALPPDSIDYAVMEKTTRALVFPLALGWNDLGSWDALYSTAKHDVFGNVVLGDVLSEDTHGCYLNARHRLVATLGLRDLILVETQDAVLVVPRQRVQEVKKLVARMKQSERPECQYHTLVQRPWGSYETLASGDRFQVKRIIVNPGAELSLQMHHHRAEHWIIVTGTAEVTNGDEVKLYTEDQSTYIPVGTAHRLRNPGKIPLVLIEIQSGTYLGEDDIVRYSDVYGRI